MESVRDTLAKIIKKLANKILQAAEEGKEGMGDILRAIEQGHDGVNDGLNDTLKAVEQAREESKAMGIRVEDMVKQLVSNVRILRNIDERLRTLSTSVNQVRMKTEATAENLARLEGKLDTLMRFIINGAARQPVSKNCITYQTTTRP